MVYHCPVQVEASPSLQIEASPCLLFPQKYYWSVQIEASPNLLFPDGVSLVCTSGDLASCSSMIYQRSVTYGDLMRVYCVNKSASRIGRKSGNVIWLAQQSVFA
jgi:hypothetical protein